MFDKTKFMLLQMSGSYRRKEVVSVVRGDWVTGGSVNSIKQFFEASAEQPWNKLLCHALASINKKTINFLGAGAHGRVFTVSDESGATTALKISLREKFSIQYEFECMEIANSLGCKVVAPVAKVVCSEVGGYYEMRDVGTKVDAKNVKDDLPHLFLSLKSLHDKRVIHGDARLDNLIKCERGYLWIDLALSKFFTPSSLESDISTFTQSILKLFGKEELLPGLNITASSLNDCFVMQLASYITQPKATTQAQPPQPVKSVIAAFSDLL